MPRKPSIDYGFATGDSVVGSDHYGGYAYHLSVTVEDGSGLHTITSWNPRGQFLTGFTCVPRDSSGVRLPPRVLLIRWEDYGGIVDSLVTPAANDTLPTICG
jgi:hypothetical protein